MVVAINLYMIFSTKAQLQTDLADIPDHKYKVAIVLGAGVINSEPTLILKERLDASVNLYKAGKIEKILMSGADWGRDYNEVEVMKKYVVNQGIPNDKVELDHGGYITYDSVMRARDVFALDNAIFITQRYHMPRTLYLANAANFEAIGFMPTEIKFNMQFKYSSREVLARVKNFFLGLWQPDTYRDGEPSWLDHT